MSIALKLAERPARDNGAAHPDSPAPSGERKPDPDAIALGLVVRELDRATAERLDLPKPMPGVLITRVEPMSSSFDGGIERGTVLLEINRHPVRSVEDYRRLTANAKVGDILALYVYKPENDSRALHTVKIE